MVPLSEQRVIVEEVWNDLTFKVLVDTGCWLLNAPSRDQWDWDEGIK